MQRIPNVCLKLLKINKVKSNDLYPVLLEWIYLFDSSPSVNLPRELQLRPEVVGNLATYFTSKHTKRHLLTLFFNQNWNDQNFDKSLKLIDDLNVSYVDVLVCYCLVLEKTSKREENIIMLLKHKYHILKSTNCTFSSEDVAMFLDYSDRLLTAVGASTSNRFEVKWFNRYITVILDFAELFESKGASLKSLSNGFSVDSFAHNLILHVDKINMSIISFNNELIEDWGNLLRPRAGYSPERREFFEASMRKVLGEVLEQKTTTLGLHRLYYSLSEVCDNIKSRDDSFDKTGVEALFDDAIIRSFHYYLNANSATDFDLNTISKWTPELGIAFAKIATQKFPAVEPSMNPHDVVIKILAWKPFIALAQLAKRSPAAKAYFQTQFNVVHNCFVSVVSELECSSISFDFFTKIFNERSAFEKICKVLSVKTEVYEIAIKNCSDISSFVESAFLNTAKLKNLIKKLRSENLEIDMSELEETIKDWHLQPLNYFAKVDPRGKVFLSCPALDESEVNVLKTFINCLESRIFSDMTFKEVQRFCLTENRICTYKQLLTTLFDSIHNKFCTLAYSLASGNIKAEAAHQMFKQYRENEKKEEIIFMFEFLTDWVNDEKQKDELKQVKWIRMDQILRLDSLRKNKDFVEALLDLKEVIRIENHFTIEDTFSKLVSHFIFINDRVIKQT